MDKVVLIHRMKRGYEMKDTDKKVNKKSNLKIYIIFAVMILASLLGGFLAGRLAAVNKDTLDGINWDHIWWITADTLPIVYGVLMLATFVVSFVMYGKIKRMIRGWDGEDEDVIVDIESDHDCLISPVCHRVRWTCVVSGVYIRCGQDVQ